MTDALPLVVSCAALAVLAATFLDAFVHRHAVPDLRDTPGGDDPPRAPGAEAASSDGAWPRLSVVVAARDEAAHVEAAMRTLLAADYPALEVVAVDDRSGDGTGAILDRLAAADARLRVIHVTALPPGWLGKNHALHAGAAAAAGELILFTDADIHFGPQTLRRAVRMLVERDRDHLTLAPDVVMPTFLLRAFVGTFALFFSIFTRPWKAADPKSRAYVGVGAFNLVRAGVYRRAGGHEPLRLRPDDDVMLAKSLKLRGARPFVAMGAGEVSVAWYATLGEVFRGLEKNMFAGIDYSLGRVVGSTVFIAAVFLWPFVGVWATDGPARWASGAAVAMLFLLYTGANVRSRTPAASVVLLPVTVTLFLACLWRSTIATLVRGGIVWRGTRYPLRELRAQRVT